MISLGSRPVLFPSCDQGCDKSLFCKARPANAISESKEIAFTLHRCETLLFFSFLVRQDWTQFSKTSEEICNSLLNVVSAEGIVYRQVTFAVEPVEAGQDQ